MKTRRSSPAHMVQSYRGGHGIPRAKTIGKSSGGVPCPECNGASCVFDSRTQPHGIRRRRACMVCGHRFTTWEIVGRSPILPQVAFSSIAHDLRLLTERFERLAAMSGERDEEDAA